MRARKALDYRWAVMNKKTGVYLKHLGRLELYNTREDVKRYYSFKPNTRTFPKELKIIKVEIWMV